MKLGTTWGILLVAALVGSALGGACSAGGGNNQFTTGSGGSGGLATTGTAQGGSGQGGDIITVGPGSGGGDAGKDQSSPTTCDSSCTSAGGVCTNGTCVLTENPGNLDANIQTMLEAGGGADPSFKFVYPYDGTVFPRGLLPPSLQFTGSYDGAYVHVSFPGLDYKGFYGSSSPPRILMSQAIWKAITLSSTGKPDVKVEVTKVSGGQVAGPASETWTLAKGSLRGTIYYETYDSQILGGASSVGIMKIQPGSQAPTIVKNGCGNVCHTASADGSTLVAATTLGQSASYDLKNNVATIHQDPSDNFTYGALYPNGSVLVSATNYRTWFGNPSHLYDTKTGVQIPAPGWDNIINNPGTPAFSPDGKKLAFNHEDTGGGHSLAMMDFDLNTKSFTNLQPVAQNPNLILAWPAFTPDTKAIVYHAGTSSEFETDNGAQGDLYWADLTTHAVARLDALDGYKNGQTYLPASDANLNFAPTVLPEAVGGYFWVVFTSHRSYGNTLPTQDHNDEYGKLWVAAFDLNGQGSTDPSHPAFYLDGQEATADNLRGFWVLDPCKADGTDCASGDECCNGYCQQAGDGGPTVCSPMSGGCSHEFEKCTTAADCCDPSFQCINGKCAQPPPPK